MARSSGKPIAFFAVVLMIGLGLCGNRRFTNDLFPLLGLLLFGVGFIGLIVSGIVALVRRK